MTKTLDGTLMCISSCTGVTVVSVVKLCLLTFPLCPAFFCTLCPAFSFADRDTYVNLFSLWLFVYFSGAHGKNVLAPVASDKEVELEMRKWLINANERSGGRDYRRKLAASRQGPPSPPPSDHQE